MLGLALEALPKSLQGFGLTGCGLGFRVQDVRVCGFIGCALGFRDLGL